MSICAVIGQEDEALAGLKTWGQLLNALEQGVDAERAVVTAVRFGGVDQPSFLRVRSAEEYDIADLLPSWQAVLRALANPESGADAGRGLPVRLRCAS